MGAKQRVSPARRQAFEILRLVHGGSHAADLLHARRGDLDTRDAALASEIVLGSLRAQAQLDFLLARHSREPAERLDHEVLIALRMGAYQILYLDRVPRHAAVGESVELVKLAHKSSAAGLVNAVLRRLDHKPPSWPDQATELSLPAWMLERWQQLYGAEIAAGIGSAFLERPRTYVRLPPGQDPPSGLELEPTEVAGCFLLRTGHADPLRIQDIGSQSIVGLLELQRGQSFLDLCAAPGNKTAQALEYGVRAVACDTSRPRLRGLEGLACARVVVDGTQPLPFARRFDRILVDAPCSGTGTLGRNPEIRWRIQPSDLARHHQRQVALVRRALERLDAGGLMVYSTCSLEPEENERVVEEALRDSPGWRSRRIVRRIPGRDAGDGFFAAVITSEVAAA